MEEVQRAGTANRRKPVGEGFDRRREYTPSEAAKAIGVCRETVHRACRDGRIPCREETYGERTLRRIRGADLEEYASAKRIPRRYWKKPDGQPV